MFHAQCLIPLRLHFALFTVFFHLLLHPPDLHLHLRCGSVRREVPCALPRMRSMTLWSSTALSQITSFRGHMGSIQLHSWIPQCVATKLMARWGQACQTQVVNLVLCVTSLGHPCGHQRRCLHHHLHHRQLARFNKLHTSCLRCRFPEGWHG